MPRGILSDVSATRLIVASILAWPAILAQQPAIPTFGTTVVVPGGLVGVLYNIQPGSTLLPDFQKLDPVGVIYTSSLDIPPRKFSEGFPGVTNRFEWFAIDYSGRFWIEKPGVYRFALTSDDGSRLYIDDQLVINNDGIHGPQIQTANFGLKGGVHRIRVSYFQGPREEVALMLQIAGPGEGLRVFSTDEFKPPADPEEWVFSDGSQGPGTSATGKRELLVSSATGSPGDEITVALSLDAIPGKELVALQWQTVVPVQLLEWVGDGPEIGSSAMASEKFVGCSMTKEYLYTCLLAGGRKPIMSGPLAIFHFKIRPAVQPRTTSVRIEQAKAATPDGLEYDLSSAQAAVNIR